MISKELSMKTIAQNTAFGGVQGVFAHESCVVPVAAGASIFLPRGVPHPFRVISAGPGRNLTILTPGGLR